MFIRNNQKVLVVTASFSKKDLAQSERASYLVKSLIDHNINVSVLTTDDENNFDFDGKVKLLPFLPKNEFFRSKLLNRLFSPFPDGHFLAFSNVKNKILKSIDNDWDVIISTSPPHSIHYISMSISKFCGAKLYLDLRDAWMSNKLISYGTFFHKKASNYLYYTYLNKADLIIANTLGLERKINSHKIKKTIITIPNGYPRDSFNNISNTTLLERYPSDLKLLYSGGTYSGRAIQVVDNMFKNHEPNLQVYFLGESFNETKVCKYIGKVTSSEVPSYLLSADVLLLYLPQEEKDSPRVLLKAYGYAKSGKPIIYIGPRNATYSFLNLHSDVYLVEEDNGEKLKKALIDINNNRYDSEINPIDFSFEKNFEILYRDCYVL